MEGKFQPLGDRVLIKDNNSGEQKSEGGLILTESTRKGTTVQGEVVAIGTGIFSQSGERIPMTVKVGDTRKIWVPKKLRLKVRSSYSSMNISYLVLLDEQS